MKKVQNNTRIKVTNKNQGKGTHHDWEHNMTGDHDIGLWAWAQIGQRFTNKWLWFLSWPHILHENKHVWPFLNWAEFYVLYESCIFHYFLDIFFFSQAFFADMRHVTVICVSLLTHWLEDISLRFTGKPRGRCQHSLLNSKMFTNTLNIMRETLWKRKKVYIEPMELKQNCVIMDTELLHFSFSNIYCFVLAFSPVICWWAVSRSLEFQLRISSTEWLDGILLLFFFLIAFH